jgi:hypothetical protein
MFNFFRKKSVAPFYFPPLEQLAKRPGDPYVSNKCIAVYAPNLEGVMVITGDFSKHTREEVNEVIIHKSEELRMQTF